MNLPTADQVNSIARQLVTFSGGMIVMFGLSTKINIDTLTAVINASSGVINNIVTLIGIITPLVAAYFAAKAVGPTAVVQSVAAMPGVTKIEVNAKATPELAALAIDLSNPKVVGLPADMPIILRSAKQQIDAIRGGQG